MIGRHVRNTANILEVLCFCPVATLYNYTDVDLLSDVVLFTCMYVELGGIAILVLHISYRKYHDITNYCNILWIDCSIRVFRS